MIVEYHRPETLEAALVLLARKNPATRPLGGGTHLSHYQGDPIAVVDLCKLGLGKIERSGDFLNIGAVATLQEIEDSAETPQGLKMVLGLEANYNLRQTATIAGTLVTGDGKSPVACAFLALDAIVALEPGEKHEPLRDWYDIQDSGTTSALMTGVTIPLEVNLSYDFVGRSPSDIPMIGVAVGKWLGGRMRVVLGGIGRRPMLVIDSTDLGGLDLAIKNAYSQSHKQENQSFFSETAKTLAHRLVEG